MIRQTRMEAEQAEQGRLAVEQQLRQQQRALGEKRKQGRG